MTVSLIAAVAANRVIGNRGSLPWRLPDDLTRFRRLTIGHSVVMGRATYLSMGKPLPRRRNIVLSREAGLRLEGCRVVHSRDEALAESADDETFIIGGAAIYGLFLPIAVRLYITWIDRDVDGDTLFPAVSWDEWKITSETPGEAGSDSFPHRFVDYQRALP
jgi:dihydrofolate reductase